MVLQNVNALTPGTSDCDMAKGLYGGMQTCLLISRELQLHGGVKKGVAWEGIDLFLLAVGCQDEARLEKSSRPKAYHQLAARNKTGISVLPVHGNQAANNLPVPENRLSPRASRKECGSAWLVYSDQTNQPIPLDCWPTELQGNKSVLSHIAKFVGICGSRNRNLIYWVTIVLRHWV